MARRARGTLLIFGAMAALFAAGLTQLFLLRFETGDVYPPYSSLRSDPLGVRVLYEALGSLPGISVKRNLNSLFKLEEGRDKTLVICGASLSKDPRRMVEALEAFAADGGRLVIAFYPMSEEPFEWKREKDHAAKKEREGSHDNGQDGDDSHPGEREPPPWARLVSIEERWGFAYAFAKLPGSNEDKPGKADAVNQAGLTGLPGQLSWHTALYFDHPSDAWRSLYAWDKHAVLIERPWGRGSIVLSSDSYYLSNEAMSLDRSPALLAWLVGASSTVLFDEAHLGVQERPSFVALALEYRLGGIFAAVAAVAALFLWRNASSLVPKRESADADFVLVIRERSVTAGMTNLLRRSIPARDLVNVCIEEWERSVLLEHPAARQRRDEVRAIAEQEAARSIRKRDPVAAYRSICEVLSAATPRAWRLSGKE